MTAQGKITTANLEIGTRILIVRESEGTARLMERDAEMVPATKQTGATVARVLEVRAGTRRNYERNVPREVVTTAGIVRAYGHQTFILAPGTPAAVKKAHVEALAENAEREIAQKEAEQATPAYLHFAKAVQTGGSYRMAIEVLHAEARAMEDANKAPELGDTVVRRGMHAAYTVKDISPVNIILWSLGTLAVAGVTPGSFHQFFYISGSESWRSRTARCLNDWHDTAPIRTKMLCPECPGPE